MSHSPSLIERGLLSTLLVVFLGSGFTAATVYAVQRNDFVARVNQQRISQSAYQQHLEQLKIFFRANAPTQGIPESVYPQMALNQLIERTLYLQEAQRRGLTISRSEIDQEWMQLQTQHYAGDRSRMLQDLSRQRYAESGFRAELKERLLVRKTQAALGARFKVPEQELKDYYQAHLADYQQPEKIEARHILLKGREDQPSQRQKAKARAEELLQQLKSGADFAQLAKQYSEDDTSKAEGGLLPAFARGEMVEPFEEAAWPLQAGQLSAKPIASEYGYHLILRGKTLPAGQKSFEDARPIFEPRLTESGRQTFLNKWVEQERQKADIVYASGYTPLTAPSGSTSPIPSP
ncbi:MAG: peptidylprolyl isomerase [Candidatus Sericytochromatia bacterium]